MNTLYFGDNLAVLRDQIPAASVDLAYLDPPFNSNANYNVLFKSPKGQDSHAQIEAFTDTWHWGPAAALEYDALFQQPNTEVANLMKALHGFLGTNDLLAYLAMMANRLLELHRVLKPTGSLYLHCDPTASHYLKILLDAVFGKENYRNEIIWKRTSSHNDSKRWMQVQDTILFYSAGNKFTWNPTYTAHDPNYVNKFYRFHDERGCYRLHEIIRTASMGPRPNLAYEYKGYTPQWGWRMVREKLEKLDQENRIEWGSSGRPYLKRYLDEQEGTPISTVITDIPPLSAMASERLGYPTQKPLALLERIIRASSNEGDVVLDPFCGCGTAVHAAQALKRQWLGIDITHLAITLIEKRLKDAFPGLQFAIQGTPQDLDGARNLAARDKYQFQWWALSLIDAQPWQGKKKGADGGIDGAIWFQDGKGADAHRLLLVSVKGGEHVTVEMVRSLGHVVTQKQAAIGLFVTLAAPTKPMRTEAAAAGFYESPYFLGQKFPRLQLLTIAGLLAGTERPHYPDLSGGALTFKQAPLADAGDGQQSLPGV